MTLGLPFRLLVRIAVRNLLAHKVKTIIVATIIAFGTALVVVGNSLVDSVNAAMAESIQSSLAGHIQIQDADAEDTLALFGAEVMGADDIGVIENFATVKAGLADIANIAAIVPMGMDNSITYGGNYVDRMLERLRAAEKSGDAVHIAALRAHVRRIVSVLATELSHLDAIASEEVLEGEDVKNLRRANADTFWTEYEADPLQALEFLENQIAPLALEEAMLFLRYVGTDIDVFSKTFNRFHIVAGEMVPPGRRGFLFNKFIYEERIKNKTARRLDKIREAREDGKRIEKEPDLQELVRSNVTQYREVVLQVDPTEADVVTAALRAALPAGAVPDDADLTAVLQVFMEMDDGNFDERYRVFYAEVAPRIQLYSLPVGSVLTLSAFTRSGYMKAVNVPIYGVFEFEGIDKSALAGIHNLMDLMTFRDLYGYRTETDRDEIAAIKADAGVADLSRDEAEDALFGGDADEPVVVERTAKGFDEFAGVDLEARQKYDEALFQRAYSQEEIDGGVILNAAIVLKDPSQLRDTMAAIEAVSQERGLGVRAVDWQTAAGLVGQFITVIRLVLYVAIFIIFTVAIVIINNSMVMATMERVREIGTLRAMGAQRRLIRWMLFIESGVLALTFGAVGALFGSAVVISLGVQGIPAPNDVLQFLFGGPRLHPFLAPMHLGLAFVIMLVVSTVSTLYPAHLATRITPLEAMQKEE